MPAAELLTPAQAPEFQADTPPWGGTKLVAETNRKQQTAKRDLAPLPVRWNFLRRLAWAFFPSCTKHLNPSQNGVASDCSTAPNPEVFARLPLGVCRINQNLCLCGQHSPYLETLLETPLERDQAAIENLFGRSAMLPSQKEQIRQVLLASLNESPDVFTVNASHLPREVIFPKTHTGIRVIEVDWQASACENQVQGFILFLRDITQPRALKLRSDRNHALSRVLFELVAMHEREYVSALEQLHEYLKDLEQELHKTKTIMDPKVMQSIRHRNQSLKGFAQLLKFATVGQRLHELDKYLARADGSADEAHWDNLRECFGKLRETLSIYDEAKSGLGSRGHQSDATVAKHHAELVRYAKHRIDNNLDAEFWTQILGRILEADHTSLGTLADRLQHGLADQAVDRGLAPPDVQVRSTHVWLLTREASEVIFAMLAQLSRYSLNDGFTQVKKGLITIEPLLADSHFRIIYSTNDDSLESSIHGNALTTAIASVQAILDDVKGAITREVLVEQGNGKRVAACVMTLPQELVKFTYTPVRLDSSRSEIGRNESTSKAS